MRCHEWLVVANKLEVTVDSVVAFDGSLDIGEHPMREHMVSERLTRIGKDREKFSRIC